MAEPRGKGKKLAVVAGAGAPAGGGASAAKGAKGTKPAKTTGGGKRGGKKKRKQPGGWQAFTDSGSVPAWLTAARLVMLLAFAATIPTILGVEHGRRLLWTVCIALLPGFWVVFGYHVWRRICPLAVVSQLGRIFGIAGQRKPGKWLSENYFLVQFALLFVGLSLRLVATNGSQEWLAGFLAVAAFAAIVVGLLYTGKTWCNYFCPVGVVEKVYTEPSRLIGIKNSQCKPCTACKKHCPDIDLEHGYWKEMGGRARRIVYFSWPGVVLAFYVYYYLVSGTWDYYFSGIWTYESDQITRWNQPGFTFLEQIPVIAAAPLTLFTFGLASYSIFSAGEAIALLLASTTDENGKRSLDPESRARTRHRSLILAGFIAFNLFYFYGGQPTLRAGPGWAVTGFGVVVVFASAAIFFRRWPRSEADHVRERFAQKLVKKWQWGDKPQGSLQDIYLLHTERTKQREERITAYKETVRELVADGVVTKAELAILDSLRAQLGVSDKEHDKVLAELSDEERQLFDPEYQGSVELRLQRQQYDRDLERAIIIAARAGREPDEDQIESIRFAHQMSEEEHEAALAALHAPDGPLANIYHAEVHEIAQLGAAAAAGRTTEAGDPSSSLAFTRHLCLWRARQHAERALTLLGAIGKRDMIQQARRDLLSTVAADRGRAVQFLVAAADSSLTHPLARAVDQLMNATAPLESGPFVAIAFDSSPYVRAAVSLVLSRFDDDDARAAMLTSTDDEEPLVREAAYRSLGSRGRLTRQLMQKALGDEDPRVRQAAVRAVTGSSTQMPAVTDAEQLAQTVGGVGNSGMYATLDASAAMESLTTLEKMMLLRGVPMFDELDPDDLEEVTYIAEERRFQAGEAICREGESGRDVFLIVSGRVRVYTGGGNVPEVTLAELERGACIGEMSAFDESPRSATVAATVRTRALVLPGAEFMNLLLARPAIGQVIIGELVGRMRKLIAAQRATS